MYEIKVFIFFVGFQGKEIAKVNKRLLENDLFKNESTAFILFQVR